MAKKMTPEQAHLKMIRELKENKDPVEVLKYIWLHWFDSHYPLEHIIFCAADDADYTLGKLVEDTLDALEEHPWGKGKDKC